MKKFHIILSISLLSILSIIVILKTFLIGGKHLFPYFGFVILCIPLFIFFIQNKSIRKVIILSGFFYLLGYSIITLCFFHIFHWPNHDHEVISIPKGYTPFEWQMEKPNSLDFDTAMLSKVVNEGRKIEYLSSVLIVKNNKLVVEQYFHGCSKNDAFNISLMTQTIVSSLIGIAINENIIKNINEKVLDLLPEYKNKAFVSDKKDLTIEHLLKNTAGLSGDKYERSFQSLNWTKSSLFRPRIKKTGDFYFQQQTAHLLSTIITKSSGINTRDFAEKFLCKPLGIKIIDWFQSPEGIYRGSNAIYFTSRDLARYGQLYLLGGKVENKQIIPVNWVAQSTSKQVDINFKINDDFNITGIGYSWLLGKIKNLDVYLASDMGGQFIINIPSKNITIITTASKPFDILLVETFICNVFSAIK